MLTKYDLEMMRKSEPNRYRAMKKRLRDDAALLDHLQRSRGIPRETCELMIAEVGADRAKTVVASLVNANAWDERIGVRARNWAWDVPGALDEEACDIINLNTEIHRCHLDEIATELSDMSRKEFKHGGAS